MNIDIEEVEVMPTTNGVTLKAAIFSPLMASLLPVPLFPSLPSSVSLHPPPPQRRHHPRPKHRNARFESDALSHCFRISYFPGFPRDKCRVRVASSDRQNVPYWGGYRKFNVGLPTSTLPPSRHFIRSTLTMSCGE